MQQLNKDILGYIISFLNYVDKGDVRLVNHILRYLRISDSNIKYIKKIWLNNSHNSKYICTSYTILMINKEIHCEDGPA